MKTSDKQNLLKYMLKTLKEIEQEILREIFHWITIG